MEPRENTLTKVINFSLTLLDGPATFFREKIVVPNQKKSTWYHQKFRRVPTIDECYADDVVCYKEAQFQFKRDKLVDSHILGILRHRYEECILYYDTGDTHFCDPMYKAYINASGAWFAKYGDLGKRSDVREAFMKQKNRMAWERRNGPIKIAKYPEEETVGA